MEETQFRKAAQLHEETADYLDAVAHHANPDGAQRSAVAAVLFSLAAYALYRVVKAHVDRQQGMSEAELRQVLIEQMDQLVQAGWTRDKALSAVMKISKEVATLRAESPLFSKFVALFVKGIG